MSIIIPSVIEPYKNGERTSDIFSRLLRDRIIFLSGEINSILSNIVIAQLLFLQKESEKKDIFIYINSVGGEINQGMAIIDTMNLVKPDVCTIAVGLAASMGAVILSCGKKGKRFSLPSSSILIHQPLGGVEGQASDIQITAQNILRAKNKLIELLAENTGQSRDRILQDSDRNFWMDAAEAKDYGLIDNILTPSLMGDSL